MKGEKGHMKNVCIMGENIESWRERGKSKELWKITIRISNLIRKIHAILINFKIV